MTGWDFRPARDLGLSGFARLRSHRREAGLSSRMTNALWRAGVRSYLAAAHRLTVLGGEHIPLEPPFVMVCNHTSHLDAMALSAALPGAIAARAVPLAAGNVFFRTVTSAAFAAIALNALPVWRAETSAADLAFLRLRLIDDRLIFILFPEGTRARNGCMARFRPGLGAFVAGSAVPVLPCFLHGAHACWPAHRRFPRPGRLRLVIGNPLRFDAVANDRDGWLHVAQIAEEAVRAIGRQTGLPPIPAR